MIINSHQNLTKDFFFKLSISLKNISFEKLFRTDFVEHKKNYFRAKIWKNPLLSEKFFISNFGTSFLDEFEAGGVTSRKTLGFRKYKIRISWGFQYTLELAQKSSTFEGLGCRCSTVVERMPHEQEVMGLFLVGRWTFFLFSFSLHPSEQVPQGGAT